MSTTSCRRESEWLERSETQTRLVIIKLLPQGGGEDQLSRKRNAVSNLDKCDNLTSGDLSVNIVYGQADGLLSLPSCYVAAKFRSSDDG